MKFSSRTSLLALPAVLFASSCSQENTFAPPPPVEVDVQNPIVKDTLVYLEFPGRTSAFSRIEIRARVKGFLKSREFRPGQFVKKGDVLFTIEPEQFQAAVTTAEGKLAQAEADQKIAKTNFDKRKQALKSKAVAEIDVLSAEAELEAAVAAFAIAEAALNDAKRDLSYTEITSPIDGRVSKEEVDIGNLVGASDPTLLTTVIQDEPIYVDFEVNEREILPFLKNRPNADRPEKIGRADEENLKLVLSDGTEIEEKGALDFLDNTINPDTGTIRARGKWANSASNLAAGNFVRIGIPENLEGAVLVPRSSVQRDLGGDYVLLVGPENVVERRVVEPTNFSEGDFRILKPFDENTGKGVKADDRIVVSNLQRARAGIKVILKEGGAEESSAPSGKKEGEPEKEPAPGASEPAE